MLAASRLRSVSIGGGPPDPELLAAGLDRVDEVLGDLQRRALELRTAPLGRITDSLPRLARDLGASLGKRVSLVVEAASIELDRSILDRLGDPLLHLVRNAVAHGIEPPAKRRASGKSETGVVRIDARRERDTIELSVADDGGGVDVEAVRRRAVETGLVPADLADDLPPAEIVRLTLRPGLSTADAISEVAGRGVGLDAVAIAVRTLGGAIDMRSEPGQGSTVVLRVPLSAAVQRVLRVGIGDECVAIPIGRIDRIEEVDAATIERSGQEAFVPIDGHPLPLLELSALLAIEPAACGPRALVLLTEAAGQRMALRIDRLLGQEEVFVKPVPPLLSGLRALCGVTVAADGRPVFVIEPARLV